MDRYASPQPSPPPATAPTARRRGLASLASASDACPLLDEARLRALFPDAPARIRIRATTRPYPSCTFTWNAATTVERRIGNRSLHTPGEGRVTLTRAAVRVADADWRRVIASYRDEALDPVPGIGEQAVWSARRSQLSVLSPRWMLHVAVEDSDAPDRVRDRAIAIARDLLEASP